MTRYALALVVVVGVVMTGRSLASHDWFVQQLEYDFAHDASSIAADRSLGTNLRTLADIIAAGEAVARAIGDERRGPPPKVEYDLRFGLLNMTLCHLGSCSKQRIWGDDASTGTFRSAGFVTWCALGVGIFLQLVGLGLTMWRRSSKGARWTSGLAVVSFAPAAAATVWLISSKFDSGMEVSGALKMAIAGAVMASGALLSLHLIKSPEAQRLGLGSPIATTSAVIPTPGSPIPGPPLPQCPSCREPLAWVAQYQRWFCQREQKWV